MKIKCIYNRISELRDDLVIKNIKNNLQRFNSDNVPISYLEMGREYVVYGITFIDNLPWFYVCDEDRDEYPIARYSGFFEIINPKFSRYWELSTEISNDLNKIFSRIVIPEWAKNDLFYERLVDGEELEVSIFKKYKKLMNEEFFSGDPNQAQYAKVTEYPMELVENWVMCTSCNESWETNNAESVISCPTCRKKFINPFYKNL